ncbi:interleukin-17 receptor C isoform X2 [Antennarius striatus]|uniref:interleukin-17 receptor C isoform X2 n=1 Tax=Antennarius striatus TaxID=241820 RepID=UPI0035B19A69
MGVFDPRLWGLWILWTVVPVRSLEMVDRHAPEITCSEGLTDCHVSSESWFIAALPDLDDGVNVTHVDLKAVLCCPAQTDCEPCLQIIITVGEVDDSAELVGFNEEEEFDPKRMAEGSGRFLHPEPKAMVIVCLSSPASSEVCKALQFKPRPSASQEPTHKLLLTERATFGSPVVVHVDAHSHGTHNVQNITVPPLQEGEVSLSNVEKMHRLTAGVAQHPHFLSVCSLDLGGTVKECDAPGLWAVMDLKRRVVVLQLDAADAAPEEIMWQMLWNEIPGELLTWPRGKRETTISSSFVAPCLCFQVWWKGRTLRRQSCPFRHQQDALEMMRHNVSVTMATCQMRGGGVGLSWNVSAPCRMDADVWLCQKELVGRRCEEVSGSRQTLHSHEAAGWRAARHTHWIKIDGLEASLEPYCPFETSRWRWSLTVLIGLPLMCLAILGAYLIQGFLKDYVWGWLKEDDVKGVVGGGHVVLLYPSDDSRALPGLMSQLGSSLQALGFSVSLDLWSQAELSILGPVPWLHSRMNQLQKQGGKVVLALTKMAWVRAEEWGVLSWDANAPRETTEGEKRGRSCAASSPCVDAFYASMSCILADYLLGRAGERFMLVQFESLPSEPLGGFHPLPEFFSGLHVYSLPSQSLGFLTELAGIPQMATASARRRRAAGLRMASRALANGLSGFTAGTAELRLAVESDCVGVGVDDSGETVPLRPVMSPSSHDTSPDDIVREWV